MGRDKILEKPREQAQSTGRNAACFVDPFYKFHSVCRVHCLSAQQQIWRVQ